jgi:hypothetical protein
MQAMLLLRAGRGIEHVLDDASTTYDPALTSKCSILLPCRPGDSLQAESFAELARAAPTQQSRKM